MLEYLIGSCEDDDMEIVSTARRLIGALKVDLVGLRRLIKPLEIDVVVMKSLTGPLDFDLFFLGLRQF